MLPNMQNHRKTLVFLGILALVGCGDDPPDTTESDVAETTDTTVDPAIDVVEDAAEDLAEDLSDEDVADDVLDGGTDGEPDLAEDADTEDVDTEDVAAAPEFARSSESAGDYAAPDGYRWARSIVHLHSTHSHDACDDVPRLEDGSYNDECVSSLRQALCDARIDVAYQTDHPTHMAEVDFVELLHLRPGDDPVLDDEGTPIANRFDCENGHRVILRAGSEHALMPVGMTRHVPGTPEERDSVMSAYTSESAAAMRDAGALIWVAHTEEKAYEDLQEIGVDGIEVYQLHANLDPRSRTEHLGLDAVGPIADLFPLLAGSTEMHPDIAFLAFVEDNAPSLARWAELLQTRLVVGTAGTDAHENTFPEEMADGERLDSYRRMMSWFSNQLLIEGELTLESAQEALGAGRVLIVFDLFGSPAGADFWLQAEDVRYEMGTTIAFAAGQTLNGLVPRPRLTGGEEGDAYGRILRASGSEWVEVLRFEGTEFSHELTEPGAYRVEVRTNGQHFAPYLDISPQFAERDVPWLMTNAWLVR